VRPHPLDGGLADAARGYVDDPLEAGVGGGVADQAQVGADVLDLASLEEGHPADHPVVDSMRAQPLLDEARLSVGPVQDGDVAERPALLLDQTADGAGDEVSLGTIVGRLLPQYRLAAG